MTNKSKTAIWGRWCAETLITSTVSCDRTVTLPFAPSRQLAPTEAAERTMWNEMTDVPASAPVTAMVAAPAATSTVAPAIAVIRFDSLRMNCSSLSLGTSRPGPGTLRSDEASPACGCRPATQIGHGDTGLALRWSSELPPEPHP